MVRIGATLPKGKVEQLNELLIKLKEIFAWHPIYMMGIATDVITHELNIDPLSKPVAQRKGR